MGIYDVVLTRCIEPISSFVLIFIFCSLYGKIVWGSFAVIPANVGIQSVQYVTKGLDLGIHRGDGKRTIFSQPPTDGRHRQTYLVALAEGVADRSALRVSPSPHPSPLKGEGALC